MKGLKNSIKMTKASSRPYVPTLQWILFYGIWIDIPRKKFQDRLWIFPLLAKYFKVPCHWRVPGPNKNLEKTQKSAHVLHQTEVSEACKIHDSKENRRFRIRLEDFRKKVIPDNETNTVDIRVCRLRRFICLYLVGPLQIDSVYQDMSHCPMTFLLLRWRTWSVSTTLRRERFSTSSPRWSSLRTGAQHGGRWSRTRTSWEPSRTSARRCRLASGWSSLLSITSERRPLREFVGKPIFYQSFSIHVMAWPLLIEGSLTKYWEIWMSKTKGSLDEATSQTRITWASLSSTSSPRSTWCRQGFVFIMPLGL